MYYIIKDTETNSYLHKGEVYFKWTSDLYFVKVFKSEKAAQRILEKIRKRYQDGGTEMTEEIFVMKGITMQEVDL